MSIQASELRLENYVYNNSGEISQVSLLGVGLVMVDKSTKAKEVNCKPIELTKDWIENLGFDRYHDELVIKLGHRFFLSFDTISKKVHTENTDTEDNSAVLHEHIKFVHQLQNLFHSLTGNELTLSKPF